MGKVKKVNQAPGMICGSALNIYPLGAGERISNGAGEMAREAELNLAQSPPPRYGIKTHMNLPFWGKG